MRGSAGDVFIALFTFLYVDLLDTTGPPPSTLNPAPSTLHPTPYTLHPQPCTLHPQPSTLNPTPSICSSLHLQPPPQIQPFALNLDRARWGCGV